MFRHRFLYTSICHVPQPIFLHFRCLASQGRRCGQSLSPGIQRQLKPPYRRSHIHLLGNEENDELSPISNTLSVTDRMNLELLQVVQFLHEQKKQKDTRRSLFMQAIRIHETGGPEVMQLEVPDVSA